MKPLTMSEEQEEKRRELSLYAASTMQMTSAVRRQRNRKAVSATLLGMAIEAAWAEVDALRAKLAEVEAHIQWNEAAINGWRKGLAASQARVWELREALVWCSGSADFGDGGVARNGWLSVCAPLLSRPTDDSALRELCERVFDEALRGIVIAIERETARVRQKGADIGADIAVHVMASISDGLANTRAIARTGCINEVLGEASPRPDGPGAEPISATQEKE